MNENDSFLNRGPIDGWIRDLAVAGIFLTRLPFCPSPPVGIADLAPAVRMFPIIGLIVGACGCLAIWLAAELNLGSVAYGLIGLAVMTSISGAIHEDGLADFADGIGGQNRLRRLEIMHDSSIGTFGVLALIFSIGLKLTMLAGFSAPSLAMSAIIVSAAISRGMIPLLMYFMRPARSDGLGHSSGRPSSKRMGAALIVCVFIAFIFLDIKSAVLALFLSAAVVLAVGFLAHRRLAGYTGDVLGAAQQCAEVTVLIVVGANA